MAITIYQKPFALSVNRQKLIHVVYSDNHENDGFKYGIYISFQNNGTTETFTTSLLVAPNFNGSCVFDLSQFLTSLRNWEYDGDVHSRSMSEINFTIYVSDSESTFTISEISFTEYWIIDGVLVPDTGSTTAVDPYYVGNGYFDPALGMKPDVLSSNPDYSYIMDATNKRALSDRKWDTHKWAFASQFGFAEDKTNTFIPVRDEDFGVLSFAWNPAVFTGNEATQIGITLVDADGNSHSFVDDLIYAENIACGFIYPSNINASAVTGIDEVRPSNYPDWKYYYVQFLDDGSLPVSMTYVFYNADLYGQHDCNYDVVRIAWQNSRMGWDYFNFIKKSEQSLTMDRRRYHKIQGDYANASTSFDYNGSVAGLTERAVITDQFQSITSDWIQEGEFELLRSLMASRQVHWVQDDGSFLPVLLEQSDFLVRKIRNGKLYNVEFKLKYANPYVI